MSEDTLLGQTLRKLREAKGLSLKSAAAALGTERHATISEIESGKRKATFAETTKLATAYGVSLPDVLDAMANRKPTTQVSVALPRVDGSLTDADKEAMARLEGIARDYMALKSVF